MLLPGQGADLCIVRSTQHVAGAVVDRAPVILFMTFTASLELAIAGNRALFAPGLVTSLPKPEKCSAMVSALSATALKRSG